MDNDLDNDADSGIGHSVFGPSVGNRTSWQRLGAISAKPSKRAKRRFTA